MIITNPDQGRILRRGMHISLKILPGSNIYTDRDFKKRLEDSVWLINSIEMLAYGPCFKFENQGPYFNPCRTKEWYVDPISNIGSMYHVVIHDFSPVFSNKGRAECFQCGCFTEKRRDFGDMSIREFCPRCKI